MTAPDSQPPSPSETYLLGKLPCRADFIRVHDGGTPALELDRWLQESAESLLASNKQLPPQLLRFLHFGPSGVPTVGVLTPSQDQVGRAYPMTISTTLSAQLARDVGSALPLACQGFLDAASDLLQEAFALGYDEVTAAARALPRVEASEARRMPEACARALRETPASELRERLFGAADAPVADYAFNTLRAAAAQVRGRPPERAPLVLDCPVTTDADVYFWCEVVQRLLQWPASGPGMIWSKAVPARLLLALGPPGPQLLSFAADAEHAGSRLWPLTTDREDAIARARAALQDDGVLQALEPARGADELVRVLCRSPGGGT